MDGGAFGRPALAGLKRVLVGTHRARPPAETLRSVEPQLGRFGITRVADITGLDRIGIPVVLAIRPNARSVAVSAGKGLDGDSARVSAIMEGIECAHAETLVRPLLLGSPAELGAGRRIVDFDRLPQPGGARVGDHDRLLWIEARELDDGAPCWVPYELVHAHYAAPALPAAGSFVATTNGLSSGNCLAEAVVHGLCEVIERDACALWQAAPAAERDARLVDPDSIDDDRAREVIDRLRAVGFGLALWDVTSDVGVAAFHCVIVDETWPDGHPGSGSGCHPDRRVALMRALLEAIQVRGVYISGARDDLDRREYENRHLDGIRREFGRASRAMAGAARRDYATIETVVHDRFEDDLAWIAGNLSRCGIGPACVVDLSEPGLEISVVRVIVPGLEGPLHGAGAAAAEARA